MQLASAAKHLGELTPPLPEFGPVTLVLSIQSLELSGVCLWKDSLLLWVCFLKICFKIRTSSMNNGQRSRGRIPRWYTKALNFPWKPDLSTKEGLELRSLLVACRAAVSFRSLVRSLSKLFLMASHSPMEFWHLPEITGNYPLPYLSWETETLILEAWSSIWPK